MRQIFLLCLQEKKGYAGNTVFFVPVSAILDQKLEHIGTPYSSKMINFKVSEYGHGSVKPLGSSWLMCVGP